MKRPLRARGDLQPSYGTIPEAAGLFGIGVKHLRQMAKEGRFPIYDCETSRPRVCFSEIEQWIRSTSGPRPRSVSVIAAVEDLVQRTRSTLHSEVDPEGSDAEVLHPQHTRTGGDSSDH